MRIKWFFIWTNLNPLHPRMLYAKFGWNWLSGSGEEDFKILSMYFSYFVIISPWKRVGPFIEQTWIPFPSPKDALCQVWLKLAQWSGDDENLKSLRQQWRRQRQRQLRRQRRRPTDNADKFWSEKLALTWAFSSGELAKTTCSRVN